MLKIALCDDDPVQLLQVTGMLQSYLAQRQEMDGKVSAFEKWQEFLDAIRSDGEDFDLYILDILMPGIAVIDLSVRLRELGGTGAIICLGSSQEYALEPYKGYAFGNLLKPVNPDALAGELDYALDTIQQKRSACVAVKTKGGTRRLPLNELLYVEMCNRVLRYHQTDGSVADSLTLRTSFQKAAEPILSDGRFFRCGTSLAVNLHYVCGLDADSLKLENGDTIPLPRGMLGEARRRWSSYWLGDPLAEQGLGVRSDSNTGNT